MILRTCFKILKYLTWISGEFYYFLESLKNENGVKKKLSGVLHTYLLIIFPLAKFWGLQFASSNIEKLEHNKLLN